jgi:hypothetical protein
MLSMPPATTISAEPALHAGHAPIMVSLHAGAADLVDGGGAGGIGQAARRACRLARRGLALRPAGSTQPISTSSMDSGLAPARSRAARMAAAPSSGARTPASPPWNFPSGVRTALAMTMGFSGMAALRRVVLRDDRYQYD